MQEPWGAFTWHPVNDHPSDKAVYDARIDVPSRWTGVFNGELLSSREVGDRRITRWHLGSPTASYLTTIAIGPFRRYTQWGPHGLPLTYWVRDTDENRLATLRRSPELLRWLEDRLGPYPFDRAGAVVVDSSSAMETQTLVTMGNEVRRSPREYRSVLLHEYAHQWYGDSVTPSTWKDLWLNEGFAMYLEARWNSDQGFIPMLRWRSYWGRGRPGVAPRVRSARGVRARRVRLDQRLLLQRADARPAARSRRREGLRPAAAGLAAGAALRQRQPQPVGALRRAGHRRGAELVRARVADLADDPAPSRRLAAEPATHVGRSATTCEPTRPWWRSASYARGSRAASSRRARRR